MRKLFYLVVSIVIFGLIISGCIFHMVPPLGQDGSIDIVKDDVFCKIDLIAGQHIVAGSITVSNDDENLFVTYETVDNWLINETHLYVGITIPTNSAPGKFPYKHEELGGVTTDTYEIPLEDLGVGPCDTIYIAAHAEIVKGETEETGWAKGVKIEPGKNWAMYFEYRLSCDIVQEVLYIHDLAEEKLNDIVEGPGIDTEYTLNNLGQYLEGQGGVDSTIVDGSLLQINYDSGLISFILLQDITTEPTLGSMKIKSTPSIPLVQQKTENKVVELKSTKHNYNLQISKDIDDVVYTGNRDVLIWVPFASEFKSWGYNVVSDFVSLFKDSTLTFNVSKLEDEEADVASLKNITDYDGMVIFNTHGDEGNWLCTGEVVPWYLSPHIYKIWLKWDHMTIWQNMKVKAEGGVLACASVFAVNSCWFESNLSGNFLNTIVLNMSCESSKTNALWDVFKDKGAGTYFGFDGITTERFATEQGYDLVKKLREGELTTGESHQLKFDPYGTNTSFWVIKGNFDLRFPRDLVSIWVLPKTMTLVEGESRSITITAYYDGGSLADIALDACTYDSSNTGVVTVDAGVITAVAEGTATITVSYTDDGISKTDTVEVTVNAITPTPEMILSPVVGDLETVSSSEQCSDTKWCFNQYKSGGHCQGRGICQADDTYAWDVNLNTPSHDSDNGMPVYAVEEGIISQTYGGCINAGGSYGQLLIEHTYQGSPWWSGYLHLKDIQVTTGQSVDQNTLLGYISNTSPEIIPNHLHFVVYKGQNSPSDLISFNTNIIPRDFPQTYYTITASAGPNGSISPSGNVTVNQGLDKSFTITPDTGYNIADVLVDGNSVGAVSSHTFTSVTEDHSISATFSATVTDIVSNVVAVYWTDHYPSNSQNIEHQINVFWDPYPEASGYKVYRSVNGVAEAEPIYNGPGELLYDKNVVQWHDLSNIVVGNTYAYYVTAYDDGWETSPSLETGTINTFLPPIYLVSPSDGETINNSTPTFEWSPVGANPGGSINSGITELWVKDLTDDKVTWDILISDMTTSNATYNQDGQASPLILGHSYAWEVTSYGSVDNMEVAISQSEYWEFTFGTVTGSVHNLTKDTYYNTIQAALDDADSLDGDIIEVSDGTYDESIIFPSGKVITLRSVNGPSSTIIRGNNGSQTATLDGALTGTTLEGFTITHADGQSGRGIYIVNSNLSIENCNIFGNSYNYSGGGIYNNFGGILTITESTISDNSSVRQYGSMSGGGIDNWGTLTITGSTISGNHASGGGGYTYYGASGGGISNNNGTLTITGSTISGNYAGGEGGAYGGGILNTGILTITESTISSNYAQSMYGTYGGGIQNGNTLTITASTISDNHADYGGGIYLSSETNVTIGGNSDTDLDNFNNFTDNYKSGSAPSADQHICDSNGDCHTNYPNNYFDPGP